MMPIMEPKRFTLWKEIAQFRIRYDRWINDVKTHFLQA